MKHTAMSLANIVKTNNGYFKSQSQMEYMFDMCNDGDNRFITAGDVRGNTFTLVYILDSEGVVEVIKSTRVKGDVITFTRKIEGILTPDELKKIKTLKRKIKRLEKDMKARIDHYEAGGYTGKESLFVNSDKRDEETLTYYQDQLAALEEQL